MFYLQYVRNELVRRRARTILTLLGLAIGVALVIAIAGLSRGLDRAQASALDPLARIGTDLTVTLQPDQGGGGAGGGGGFGGPGGGGFGGGGQLLQANQAAITDLSKLGKPGQHFVHDFFLPGTQLTFPQSQAKQIAALPGVAAVSAGLLLSGVHQEGTVPKIVAKIKTGGQQINVFRRITPPTPAEFAKIQACLQKAGVGPRPQAPPAGGGGRLGGGGGGGRGGLFDNAAARKCFPQRFRQFRARITTPRQTLQQIVAPPQTNIASSSYSIGGVDLAQRGIGLVTPGLVTKGRALDKNGEALLAESYASRQKLKVGSTLDLNGTTFTVIGLVKPPLGGQTADVYVPLGQLQTLAHQNRAANVVLVRAADSASVASVQSAIERQFPNAQVASAKQVAASISGSLVDAADLSHRLGIALAAIAAAAAFLLAALLTLSSVGKRVRELGTLKALGWTQRQVVRQVVAESVTQGALGGVVGVALGLAISLAIGAVAPTLSASSTSSGGDLFGLGQIAHKASENVTLTAPIGALPLLAGFGLALLGGLLAGAAGGLRAARLRPADALRTVE